MLKPSFLFGSIRPMQTKVARIARQFPDQVAAALTEEAEIEATEVRRRTPVATGALKGTIHVVPPERTGFAGRDIEAYVVAGGVAAPYALVVHEDLEAFHPVGQAKYLESVILESRPFMGERIARRVQFTRLPI